ncbi:hypothetical protein P153DRAFT_385788 [Dothidotthia symphoricarpi CBS 119687]|uniref:Zn(2)-C6 fungal-type domain-containing protein n=1 Tax=Dothidotthia symphoricarpi CBS 119687 TaxID=1392245 RepID=A0A6A6ACF4_9PLEO|nr:uncharacterized protein P153DRAFT_385788 [Dothidotthia symphoricarpi CBS 119687]KAF2129582.1 hypothetical protein P153DRAFT_385788 [Dothidotthia symphoricarpi CBS 119687]
MVDQRQHQFATQHMKRPSLGGRADTPQFAELQFYQTHNVFSTEEIGNLDQSTHADGPIAAASHSEQEAMLHERSGRSNATSGPVRRRISRACDQCNQLRTKCDGRKPCTHCIEFGLTCEYIRERKKRGKASRKDIAQQQATAKAGNVTLSSKESSPQSQEDAIEAGYASFKLSKGRRSLTKPPVSDRTEEIEHTSTYPNRMMTTNDANLETTVPQLQLQVQPRIQTQGHLIHNSIPQYTAMDDFSQNITYQPPHLMLQTGMHTILPSHSHGMDYSDSSYSATSPHSAHAQVPPNPIRLPDESVNMGFVTHSPVAGSPGWIFPSPSTTVYSGAPHFTQYLKYPVLQPLIPHLANIMPIPLACDLLELYFQSSSSAFMQPVSPYVLGYVFRKRSFLRQHNPRVCSPALLASMLWIGCLTSDSPYLSSSPSARSQLSEKLINLTISLLKPLVHQTLDDSDTNGTTYDNNNIYCGVTMNGFGMPTQVSEISLPGAPAALDDVATYMHLATAISASEYKAASLRWWNAAWSLAKELKLSKELPVTPSLDSTHKDVSDVFNLEHMGGMYASGQGNTIELTEEQREERRRIWWLLYTVDRHLALCYNRPLSFSDAECSGLMQPLDDNVWQAGELFEDSAHRSPDPAMRRRGPASDCTGNFVFGFFLPLMTILGEIVDLNHARSHPRFGMNIDWDGHASEISQKLKDYGQSLQSLQHRAAAEVNAEVQDQDTLSARSINSPTSRAQESLMQAKIVVAYGTHLMHTLHILLNGKWDPISLLDDNDHWIATQSFVDATGHAVSAADALNEILEHDPDLSFMPFLFGIYLLQGSFLLLLIADKMQTDASANIVRACEVIVRAHEACIVTLNTEYQRNFRKVMRSALQQVRGRDPDEHAELAQQRRREMLSMYRWSGDGTGLAL